MQRKMVLTIIILSLLLASVASAAYYIYSGISNPIQVGGLALSTPTAAFTDDGHVIITGSLLNNGDGVSGATVALYTNVSATETDILTTHIQNVITASDGTYSYTYLPANGTYRYQARYQVTP